MSSSDQQTLRRALAESADVSTTYADPRAAAATAWIAAVRHRRRRRVAVPLLVLAVGLLVLVASASLSTGVRWRPATPAAATNGAGSMPLLVPRTPLAIPSVVDRPIARAAVVVSGRQVAVGLHSADRLVAVSADGDAYRWLPVPPDAPWSLSPDGKQVAWVADAQRHAQRLSVLTLSTGHTSARGLPSTWGLGGHAQQAPFWSPDSRTVAWSNDVIFELDGSSYGGRSWVYAAAADRGAVRVVSKNGQVPLGWRGSDHLLAQNADGTKLEVVDLSGRVAASEPMPQFGLGASEGCNQQIIGTLPWLSCSGGAINANRTAAGPAVVVALKIVDVPTGAVRTSDGELPLPTGSRVAVSPLAWLGSSRLIASQAISLENASGSYTNSVRVVSMPPQGGVASLVTETAPGNGMPTVQVAVDVVAGGQTRPGEPPPSAWRSPGAMGRTLTASFGVAGLMLIVLVVVGLLWLGMRLMAEPPFRRAAASPALRRS